MEQWNLQKCMALLMTVLILDGILLGAFAGVWNYSRTTRLTTVGAEPVEPKMVALTFDDGPHKIYTAELLDGLKERHVPVTFFLMGKNIEGNEDLVKRMKQEGHLIGNHSYSHVELTKRKENMACDDIDYTGQMIEDIVGSKPQYLRPPYGAWNEDLECRMDLTTVFWTVDSLDWKFKDKSRIVKQVIKRTDESSIILMHDIFPTSVEAALEIIDQLQEEGYTFVTVDELLID